MKYFLIFTLILALSCGSKSDNTQQEAQDEVKKEILKYTLDTDNIKGSVKKYIESFQNVHLDTDMNIIEDSLGKERDTYTIRNFDNKGVWTESKIYMNGELIINVTVHFSDDGAYIGTENKDKSGNIRSETKVTEFTDKKLTEENIMDGEVVYRRTRFFDKKKTTKMVVDNKVDEYSYHSEYTYTIDKNDLPSQYHFILTQNDQVISDDEQIIEYLKFDDTGNWTKRLTYKNGTHSGQLTIREFEYYK